MPRGMKKYLSNYGRHFTHQMYKFAVEHMYKKVANTDKKEKMQPVEKDKVNELLKKYNLTLINDNMYDATYLYSMGMSDYMSTAFPTEEVLMKWVKCTIDDIDKPDGFIWNRWYADMCLAGIGIDWDDFI
jgi:hypothetical protein